MEKLNPTSIYVLSIVSFLCCCFGGLGVLLAGPAFIMANNKLKDANTNPDKYDATSVKNMKTAKIIALVALIINALYLIMTVYRLTTTDWDVLMEQQKQILEQYGIEE